jgi:PTH1 family peptidyl-tRNA hydrolase
MALLKIIIGLGNPGDEYERTRHNIGFMAVDEIASFENAGGWKKKFRGLIATFGNVLLLKPQTYMNISGESAREALDFYQIKCEQVIVFHDDIDLPSGEVRIKQGGGHGGHNGLKSLDTHIGQNYWRVRIGVGRPMTEQGIAVKGDAVSDYVLNPFSKADKIWVADLVDALARHVGLLLDGKEKEYLAKLPKIS